MRSCFNISDAKSLTHFGISSLGLRLGDDSICNLSPEMIKQFCEPAYKLVNETWGGKGHIHCCSLAHSRFEHLYPTLLSMPDIAVISSQFGFEYYQENNEKLRGHLAVETFYGDALRYVIREYGSFSNWAYDFVPKYKNKSGLVLYCQVSSVEEGENIWKTWQKAHRR